MQRWSFTNICISSIFLRHFPPIEYGLNYKNIYNSCLHRQVLSLLTMSYSYLYRWFKRKRVFFRQKQNTCLYFYGITWIFMHFDCFHLDRLRLAVLDGFRGICGGYFFFQKGVLSAVVVCKYLKKPWVLNKVVSIYSMDFSCWVRSRRSATGVY